jgi:hypothetical protein
MAVPLQHLHWEGVRGGGAAGGAGHVTQLRCLRTSLDAARYVCAVDVTIVAERIHLFNKY